MGASPTPPSRARTGTLRLDIDPVIEAASRLAERVRSDLPQQAALVQAADSIALAARDARRVSRRMHRAISLHRLPVIFLAASLLTLGVWTWATFLRVTTLTLALPDRDAAELKDALRSNPRLQVRIVEVPGSREAAEKVARREVDLAFVQGGVAFEPGLRHAELPGREIVVFMTRRVGLPLSEASTVLTSREGEGSHAVLLEFLRLAGGSRPPRILHGWEPLTAEAGGAVPAGVDAVFVVKDPTDEKTQRGIASLAREGFVSSELPLGARALRLPWLERIRLEKGWLCDAPPVPAEETPAWGVKTLLVAREGLTPRLLAQANRLLSPRGRQLAEDAVALSPGAAGEVFQGIDAFLGVLVNIGLAFLALLGLDAWAWRRQFHELNALVSLLGQLQSDRDVLLVRDPGLRAENMRYLSTVSDLLGVISHLSSWYTQENSALAFNSLSDVIHERCNALKINIQLKLLQAGIPG